MLSKKFSIFAFQSIKIDGRIWNVQIKGWKGEFIVGVVFILTVNVEYFRSVEK